MKSKLLLILFILLVNVLEYSNAQENDINIKVGELIKIYSEIIGEEREILISLPFGYEQSKKEYPVIYRLDGSIGGLIVSGGLLKYLSLESIPEMICVMIPNTDRGRDLSILPMDQLPASGGAENFLRFITEELIPFVDNKYRTTNYRIITGGSAGGEIVLYSLMKHPDSFDAFIAASPAMFSGDYLLDRLRSLFKNRESFSKTLIIPTYDRDFTVITKNLPILQGIIADNAPTDFTWETIYYSGKAHVPNQYLLDGLQAIFKNWKPVQEPVAIPTYGNIADGDSIEIRLISGEDEIRYTFNGEEPTRNSELYKEKIVINEPAALKVKAFRANLDESRTATFEYKNDQEIIPLENIKSLIPGLYYKYFEKCWFYLPEKIDLEPEEAGTIDRFDNSVRKKDEGYILQYDGYIKINKEGRYCFYVKSSSDAKFLLNEKLLIECSGSKSSSNPAYEFEEYSYESNLKSGIYSIQLMFANAWFHDNILEVYYEGPGIEKQEIPGNVLWH